MYFSTTKLYSVLVVVLVLLFCFKSVLKTTFIIATLPITWQFHSSDFYISETRDNFDLSFSNYSIDQQSSLPEYEDQVPAILHQIALGGELKESWVQARNNCLQHHHDWETYLWTNENATHFVEEKFPLLKDTWYGYKYPIQRVDALRYMLLYEYGGMIFSFPSLTAADNKKELCLIWILTVGGPWDL
jgi:mannosyltransferase OCH1-like enzyme